MAEAPDLRVRVKVLEGVVDAYSKDQVALREELSRMRYEHRLIMDALAESGAVVTENFDPVIAAHSLRATIRDQQRQLDYRWRTENNRIRQAVHEVLVALEEPMVPHDHLGRTGSDRDVQAVRRENYDEATAAVASRLMARQEMTEKAQ